MHQTKVHGSGCLHRSRRSSSRNIPVAVITRGQGGSGKYAAAVAAQVYRSLGHQIVRTDRNLAQTEFHLKPKTNVDLQTAAKLADADDEDADETTAEVAGCQRRQEHCRCRPMHLKTVTAPPKKLVTKTGDSKPVFPPVVITYDKDPKDKDAKKIRRPASDQAPINPPTAHLMRSTRHADSGGYCVFYLLNPVFRLDRNAKLTDYLPFQKISFD